MGKLFLIGSLLAMGPFCFAKGQTPILPLDMPALAPLPVSTPQTLQQDLDRLQQKHRQEKSPPVGVASHQAEKLAEESVKSRPYRGLLQIGLVLPQVWVQAPRSRYTTELTSQVWGAVRVTGADAQGWHLWLGARMAPFSGTAQVEETSGRYGIVYWGPVFALGKINPPSEVVPQDRGKIRIEGRPQQVNHIRTAWMWLGGVALQSSIGEVEPASETIEKELKTKSVDFDATAVWVECMYAHIYYGAIGVHPSIGVQYGKGLSFAWVSLAFGGWY
jgi:hypothetical protein